MQNQDKIIKEWLKSVLDQNSIYSDKEKIELKLLVDSSKSAYELLQAVLVYLGLIK